MPTLQGTTLRLALNQSSRVGAKEALSGDKLVLWQGLPAQVECGLFLDDPEESTFQTNIGNVVSATLTVRRSSPNGGILFVQEASGLALNGSTTYAQWIAETSQHITFSVTAADTTQTLPASGRLPIYYSVTLTLSNDNDSIAGFGYGEIQNVGYIENPTPGDYEEGTTQIRGGKLVTTLDANGFDIVNLPFSGPGYVETGNEALAIGQLEVDVVFSHEKIAATYGFLPYPYITDSSDPPQVIFPVVVEGSQTTTGFTVKLSGSPTTTNCKLFWGVALLDAESPVQRAAGAPVYMEVSIYVPTKKTFAYRTCALDSNYDTGGGTNDLTAIQDLLNLGLNGPLVVDFEGLCAGLNTASTNTCLLAYPGTEIHNADFFLAANCPNAYIITSPQSGAAFSNENISLINCRINANGQNQVNRNGDAGFTGNDRVEFGIVGAAKSVLWFNKFKNVTLEHVTIRNSMVYNVLFQEGDGIYTRDVKFIDDTGDDGYGKAYNHDGFHLLGPINNGKFQDTEGNGDDDIFGFNTNEHQGQGDSRRSDADPTGKISNVLVDGLRFTNGGASIRLYGEGSTLGVLDAITFQNVWGHRKSLRPLSFCSGVDIGRIMFRGFNPTHQSNNAYSQLNIDNAEYVRVDEFGSQVPIAITNTLVLEGDAAPRLSVFQFTNHLQDKIILYAGSFSPTSPRYGFGVAGSEMRLFVDNPTDSFTFGETSGDGTFKPKFRLPALDGGIEAWMSPTLQNSWVDFAGGFDGAGYRKNFSGIVWLRGLIKNGTASTTPPTNVLFTLPVGYRPPNSKLFLSFSNGTPIVIGVNATNGNVVVDSGPVSSTYISLENISFSSLG